MNISADAKIEQMKTVPIIEFPQCQNFLSPHLFKDSESIEFSSK